MEDHNNMCSKDKVGQKLIDQSKLNTFQLTKGRTNISYNL